MGLIEAPAAATRRLGPHLPTAAAVVAAAAAMVATLPGRTHGLGLITEPLLADLGIGRVPYAAVNFWATLLGAAFCLPAGWALDRLGVRSVLAAVLLGLGAVTIAMTRLAAGGGAIELPVPEVAFAGRLAWVGVPRGLFVLVTLTRGLGQGALSVVSLALVGKAAGARPGAVMGVYSFLVAVGYMVAFGAAKTVLEADGADWRTLWAGIGWLLVGGAVLAALVVREPRPANESPPISAPATADAAKSLTLAAALHYPAFWVFALATSFYGLVAAGMSVFNESLLAERGFDRSVFLTITAIMPLVGLAANLCAGWAATWLRLGVLLACGLLIQTGALAAFPAVDSLPQIYVYAASMGVAGGILTVVFFTVWRQAFGPAYLGQIQGAAQVLTVLASAAGPLILAAGQEAHGSYAPIVRQLAVASGIFAVAALVVPLPSARKGMQPMQSARATLADRDTG
jgi:hypothetical protein